MEELHPKVSIIISTYNRADRFLRNAINSVLSQTFKDFELIIVDDCSTDATEELVTPLLDDPRIKYIKLDQNSGTDALPKNTGIMAAKGEWIGFCDDDVEWLPYHLEILLKKADRMPELDVLYCDMWLYNADKPEWEGQMGIAYNFDAQFLLNRNYIDFSEALIKRDVLYSVGGIDQELKRFKDWNLFVRLAKWGAKFQRVPVIGCSYYFHKDTCSNRNPVRSWPDPRTGIVMFEPTFDPAGCKIYLPYLGDDKEEEKNPKVAIYTITYDRLDYTKRMYESLRTSTDYPFDWFVWDNGSQDGTPGWLADKVKEHQFRFNEKNVGITQASNELLDKIDQSGSYQIIIKADNDCEFMTKYWLESFIDLWKRNHMLYISPYVEGLVDNPGGAPRIGQSTIGPYLIEVTQHIGGICAAIDSKAYKGFRWQDKFLHGNQDREASIYFMKEGYMPCYLPMHRIMHMDTTQGQKEKYPDYFERRKQEKCTQAG